MKKKENTTKERGNKTKIPKLKTIQEERAFWNKHSVKV
jgi:hypothetical protein